MGTPTSGDYEAAGEPAARGTDAAFGLPGSGYEVPRDPYLVGPSDPDQTASARPGRAEVFATLAVAVVVAALGLPLGALWSSVAPWVPAVQRDGGAVLADPEGEQMIGAEGWYVIITVTAGIVLAVLAWVVLRRYRGALVALALAVGSVAAGILTFRVGHDIGLAHARSLADHAPVGATFSIPPNLRVQQIGLWHGIVPYARGDVLALAIAAVLTYVLLTAFSPHPALRRPDPVAGPPFPPGYGPPGYGPPGYDAPGYGPPGYGAPGYDAPGYGAPPAPGYDAPGR